jgi:hypothetical protein
LTIDLYVLHSCAPLPLPDGAPMHSCHWQLAPLVHDPSPAVREALVDLVLCCASSRALHFWEVVPQESLLGALVGDASAQVAAKVRVALHLLPQPFAKSWLCCYQHTMPKGQGRRV